MSIKFDKNIIPAIPKKTLGTLEFGAVSKIVEEFDEKNQRTGELLEKHIDVMSDVQQSVITVVLPPGIDLEQFSFGDRIELEGVTFKVWASIAPDSTSNYAESDVKVTAQNIKKVEVKNPVKSERKSDN